MFEKIKSIVMNNNIIKNTIIMFSGQTVASAIGFINTFLVLKAIGLEGNGIIAIAANYAGMFNGLFNFQSYNAMIKFGADALEKNDMPQFKKYLKQAVLQDVLTAILAFIVGYMCIDYVSDFFNWDSQMVSYIKLYLLTIPFNISGSINAVIRLKNDFVVGAKIGIQMTLIKTVLLLVGIVAKFEFKYYILLEIIMSIISSSLYIKSAIKYLKLTNCTDFLKVKIGFDKEFTMFNIYNNIVSTLDMPTGQITTLVINKLLGVSEVGVYNVIAKFGTLVTQVTGPLTQSLFPELSKIVAKDDEKGAFLIVKKIFIYTVGGGGVVALFTIISYKLWLGLFIPATFENGVLMSLYVIYITVTSAVAGIHLLFVCLNLVRYNVPIVAICNAIYLGLLYILAIKFRLFGIIMALIIQAVMVAMIKYSIMKRNIKDEQNEEYSNTLYMYR